MELEYFPAGPADLVLKGKLAAPVRVGRPEGKGLTEDVSLLFGVGENYMRRRK